MALADGKYMLLTTFRRDGTPVATPVWVVGLEGASVGFWTSSASGKAKRLRHTSRVIVQPSNMRGAVTLGSQPVEGTARLVTGDELETIRTKVRAKYGIMTHITKLLAQLGGMVKRKQLPYGDVGVVVTPG